MSVSNNDSSTTTSGGPVETTPQDVVKCGEMLSNCPCAEPHGHVHRGEETHRCDCGGSWVGTEGGDLTIVLYPGGLTYEQARAAMLAAMFGDVR